MTFETSHMFNTLTISNNIESYSIKLLSTLALIFSTLIPIESYADNVSEYKIKAAFIYNFARFTQWPDNDDELKICIYGNDPFGHYIDDLNSKKVGSRTIKIIRTHIIETIKPCHVVFLNIIPPEKNQFKKIIDRIKDTNALTMSDTKNSIDYGVMVGFEINNNRVSFDINYTAAKQAGLKISSQLLVISKKVI